ncbi:serine/threonine-protein phosphatase 6 regulatory ankyrin repeat subunit C-like isoform X2 [Littorina saxatilis]|uniref:SOCS box domain-containing protein n=1 Tax=Littorina saxatilis TaxID=31220 RepID=A0AAN9B1P4_9CAEN
MRVTSLDKTPRRVGGLEPHSVKKFENEKTVMGQSLEKVCELEAAIKQGPDALPVVTALLKAGVSASAAHGPRSVLYFAIEHDCTSAAELLLDHGADVRKGYYTETPLHCAASRGNVSIVSKLLERGAQVNTKNHNHCTPLWQAASEGHYDVVHLLLQQPDVDVDCPCGDTFLKRSFQSSPLGEAVLQQHVNISQELLRKGADANLSDIKGHTPLHHASSAGNQELVRLLVQHGCSLDCVDKRGYTPLHTAVSHGHLSAVKTLLAAGCDANIPCSGRNDFTALHFAAVRGFANIAAALCSVDSVQIDIRGRTSETPLVVAYCCLQGLSELTIGTANQPSNVEEEEGNATVYGVAGCGIGPLFQEVCVTRGDQNQERNLWHRGCTSPGDHRSPGDHVDENMTSQEVAGVGCSNQANCTHCVDQASKPSKGDGSPSSSDLNSAVGLVWSMFRSLFPEERTPHLDILHILISRGADLCVKTEFGETLTVHAVNRVRLQPLLILMCHGATIDKEFLSKCLSNDADFVHTKWKRQLIEPVVLALAWSSVRCHRFFSSFAIRSPTHALVTDLPLSVKEELDQPLSLTRLCRSAVRHVLTRRTTRSIAPLVDKLPLPYSVKQFLMLSDVLQTLAASRGSGIF